MSYNSYAVPKILLVMIIIMSNSYTVYKIWRVSLIVTITIPSLYKTEQINTYLTVHSINQVQAAQFGPRVNHKKPGQRYQSVSESYLR